MVDHKKSKHENVAKHGDAVGSDKKNQAKESDASTAASKNPTAIMNDEEMAHGKKQPLASMNKKPAGGQEGMRPKAKKEDEEGKKGSKSRHAPTSNR